MCTQCKRGDITHLMNSKTVCTHLQVHLLWFFYFFLIMLSVQIIFICKITHQSFSFISISICHSSWGNSNIYFQMRESSITLCLAMGECVCALLYYYYLFFGGVQWWSVCQKSIVGVYILLKLITIMLYTIELNWFSNDLTWAQQWHYSLLLYSLLLY